MKNGTRRGSGALRSALQALERTMIEEALARHHGHQAEAAADLGITERIMGLRMRKYALDRRAYRGGPPPDAAQASGGAAERREQVVHRGLRGA